MKISKVDDKLESILVRTGYDLVIGVDEVGRGSWAGPVVACAFLYNSKAKILSSVNDSKQLTLLQREKISQELKSQVFSFGLVESFEIDEVNIVNATILAIQRSLERFDLSKAVVLVDGYFKEQFDFDHRFITKGDTKHYSIAAASIMAKVFRDKLMREYSLLFPDYGFDTHVGYGTKKHISALERNGACAIHRRSYAPIKKYIHQEGVVDDL